MVNGTAKRKGSPLFAFAGGGTGGHLYPALAIVDSLGKRLPDARFVFFGTQRPIDGQILAQTGLELVRQTLRPLSRKPWQWPSVYWGLRRSSLVCRARFVRDRPALVLGCGGLGSVPAVREAHRAGITTVLLSPDALPGRANRYLAARASIVFAQWPETAERLPRMTEVLVLGCPVRPEFNRADPQSGYERFGLDVNRKTLLVTGASQGARTVNEAVLANLDYLESTDQWQVLHLTGEHDCEAVQAAYRGRRVSARVLAFTNHMADALGVADLVVSRAGASTLAEITAVGRASILLPYPFDRYQHQLANARCLVRASAARLVHDRRDVTVNGPALREALEDLMSSDDSRAALALAARRIGRGNAASQIAERLLSMIQPSETAPADESVKASC